MVRRYFSKTLLIVSSVLFSFSFRPFKEAKGINQKTFNVHFKQQNTNRNDCPRDLGTKGSADYVEITTNNLTQTTSFNLTNYFTNLIDYSAYNSVGSCAYVSLCGLLSYYDTFHNDAIIPEAYDRCNTSATTETEAKLISPGVARVPYDATQYGSYYNFCHQTMSDNLQSKLTVLQNQLSGTDNDGVSINNQNIQTPNFSGQIQGDSYQNLLNEFYANSDFNIQVSRIRDGYTQEQKLFYLKAILYSGYPAIVEIKRFVNNIEVAYHSVIAYEIDAEENVYANYGWGAYGNHFTILGGPEGYNYIEAIYTFSMFEVPHSHSNNYCFGNMHFCGCNLDDTIHIKQQYLYVNVPPILYWMRNVDYSDEFYRITVYGHGSGSEIFTFMASSNEVHLSLNQWNMLMESGYSAFDFYLRRYNNSFDFQYLPTITTLYKSNNSVNMCGMAPISFLLPDSYCPTVEETYRQVGDLHFTLRRLRTGFIQYETVNLSPRRQGAGLAFLEMEFDAEVTMIEVDISFWGRHEATDSSNATGYIQYKDSQNSYQNLIDLYNDITLSKDRYNQNHLYLMLPERSSFIRFYTTAEAVGNTNKGRIAIGGLNVYYFD